jgi:hypothetical protein
VTAELNELLTDPTRRARLERRFWAKIDMCGSDDCWPWIAKARTGIGYGAILVSKYATHAHRVAWALRNGPIPDGTMIRQGHWLKYAAAFLCNDP